MTLIAVTGGIGAGKSTVLKYFEAEGSRTVEADKLAHDLYQPGTELHREISDRWGEAILRKDKTIDRQRLASIVFQNPGELAWLNKKTHPAVKEKIFELAHEPRNTPFFCAIPLLYETGWEDDWNWVICVWCDWKTQKQRLCQRGWNEAQIKKRKQALMPMNKKAEKADITIINNGSLTVLEEQCRLALTKIKREK